MKLKHNTFGLGEVINQDSTNVTISFNGEVKTLIIAYARLTNEDGTAFGVTFVPEVKKTKKLNQANFMSKEEFSKSKYANMNNDEYLEMIKNDARNSKSF